jgi:2,3-bisphosphoglycerate-dependent phosphoglycerate mutase
MEKAKLILMRHGQSEWNKKNLFTGWVDIPLSIEGIQEAVSAGQKISEMPIDVIFVSSLIRAQMSAFIAMAEHKLGRIPVIVHEENEKMLGWSTNHNPRAEESTVPVFCSLALNERMYGELQGLNKQETIDKYGPEQVKIWRRSYDVAPPGGESLAMTADRAVPYFKERILPFLERGKNVLVSAHGNSLRAIVMYLLQLTKEQVLELELTTGEPMIFCFDGSRWVRQ